MKINSAQLEAFYSVARILNFTRAAESLHVTQSALSQRIAKLEEEMGTSLFIRDRTSIRLTEAGEQVLRYCQTHEAIETELLAKLKDSRDDFAGVLRIAGFSSVNRSLVIPSLKKIMSKNPRLSIQLITKELHELPSMLRSAEADYILTTKKSDSPNIESIFLGYEENYLVRSKKAAESEIYLDHDESDLVTRSYFAQNKMSFKPSGMRYLDDVYGLIDGVKNGLGKAVLPYHLIENDSDLEIIDSRKRLLVSVYLQYFVQPYYRPLHTKVIEDIKDYFNQNLKQGR